MLHRNKKEQTSNVSNNMDESQNWYIKWKRPVTKEHILFVSIYMKFRNRQKAIYDDRSQSSDYLWGGSRMNWKETYKNLLR